MYIISLNGHTNGNAVQDARLTAQFAPKPLGEAPGG